MGSKQLTWWQQMGAISRGMMFLDGSIVTPESLQPAEREPVPRDSPAPIAAVPRAPAKTRIRAARLKQQALWWWDDLLLLGGRPTTVRHNDDIDEPFPPRHRRHRLIHRHRLQVAQNCMSCGSPP